MTRSQLNLRYCSSTCWEGLQYHERFGYRRSPQSNFWQRISQPRPRKGLRLHHNVQFLGI